MSDAEVQRVIGRLEAQVTALTNLVAALTAKMERVENKLDDVEKTLSEARGGWRVLMWVGGASGSVGAAVSYLASHFLTRPGP